MANDMTINKHIDDTMQTNYQPIREQDAIVPQNQIESPDLEKRNETKYFEGPLFIFAEFKLVLVERHDRTVAQTQSLWIPLVSGDAIGINVF